MEMNELQATLSAHDAWACGREGGRRADLAGFNLAGANLSGANLVSAYLLDANLTGANLAGSVLSSATLSGATLVGAELRRADLFGADLRMADLTDANLTDAELTKAELADADLTGADLTGANLHGANLELAWLPAGLRFRRAWAGGPRHRTATVWTWEGQLRVRQGCIDASSAAEYLAQFDSDRDIDWDEGDVERCIATVLDAIGQVTG